MKTVLKTAPVLFPVTLTEAKKQCEIIGTDHDDYIEYLIAVATDQVEQYLRRRLITQTWYLYMDDWPRADYFNLPFGKLQSVTSIAYKDEDGDSSTFASADYIVEITSDPGRVVLGYNDVWPTDTLYPSNPITVEFVCGYGLTGASVPAAIRHAIRVAISDMFEQREEIVIGTISSRIDIGKSLLEPHRLWV